MHPILAQCIDAQRRALLVALPLLALGLAAPGAPAREVTDATGRVVTVPEAPARVFAAGPPASVMLYALAPERMIGWTRAPADADRPFLQPSTRDLPTLGRLAGRGGDLNLEVLIAHQPDLVVDFGAVTPLYADLARRVQEQTGLPYILLDGRFDATPAALRALGAALGEEARAEKLAVYAEETFALVDRVLETTPEAARPVVYLARGAEGLESAGPRSLNAEIIARVGARNAVASDDPGLVAVSLEQVLAAAPDVIVTIDSAFARSVATRPEWTQVPAVASGRVLLAPAAPFGFIDSPPSVNRLIGLRWLLHRLYPDRTPGDLRSEVREFYSLFYGVTPDDAQLDSLLGG